LKRPVAHQRSASDASKVMSLIEYAHLCETGVINMPEATLREFQELLLALKHPVTGLAIANRKWRLKIYPNCFVASDAITWIGQYYSCTRPLAMRVATYIQRAGYIDHCLNQHIIKDSYLFFRFVENPHTDGLDWSPATRRIVFKQKNINSPSNKKRTESTYDNPIQKQEKSFVSMNREIYDRVFDDTSLHAAVTITIECAENISTIDYSKIYASVDKAYELQPYCMIEVAGQVRKTSVKSGSNPKWDETFKFTMKSLPVTCNIVMFDKDKDTFFGNMIGYAQIKIDVVGLISSTMVSLKIPDDAKKRNESTQGIIQLRYRSDSL
jgi:hypothetical protein